MAEKPHCLACDTPSTCRAHEECLDGNMPKKVAPLSAGAVPKLPVVAWQAADFGSSFISQRAWENNWFYLEAYTIPLTPHTPAQATIAAQAAEIERLKRERDAAFAMSRCECSPDECCANLVALKAKQVADVEAVMRLADKYAEQYAAQFATRCPIGTYHRAAREALRSHLTKDRL